MQSSQRRAAKIMTVLNGEEEPPAVKLTLVVTLEEQGMLSSDLPIFGCFIVCWGFFFFFYPFPLVSWRDLPRSCCSPRGDGVLQGGLSSEIALTQAAAWGFGDICSESWQLSHSCDG